MTPVEAICRLDIVIQELEMEKQSWHNWLNPFWPSIRVMFNRKIKRYIFARRRLEKNYGTA